MRGAQNKPNDDKEKDVASIPIHLIPYYSVAGARNSRSRTLATVINYFVSSYVRW